MISVNSRFPDAPLPAGTAIAIQPSTPVRPIIPRISTSRPRADRARIRMPSAPMAYAATHLDASARPSSTPMTGISVQKAQRGRRGSIHSQANTA